MKSVEELVFTRKTFPCGCKSDNCQLFPCEEHEGPVGTAKNLRSTDPRLNVRHGPSLVKLEFMTAQGQRVKHRVVVTPEGILKILNLMGELDLLDQDEDEEDECTCPTPGCVVHDSVLSDGRGM